VRYNAVDLFAGCGGLSEGLGQAGFEVVAAVEIEPNAAKAYEMNHKDTTLFVEDIRDLDASQILDLLQGSPLHLLAGCPPCQGFSSVRRLNRREAVPDPRNDLILEYLRFVKELKPLTIMMENVPGIAEYELLKALIGQLQELGYNIGQAVVDVADYGVPQRRKRFVLVGSMLGSVEIAKASGLRRTVKDIIGTLPSAMTEDPLHKIFPCHNPRIQRMIELIPHDGGSRKDLPEDYILDCHKKENVGFNDVYGRLRWDDVSSTITGGCLNPSKGRFLHPEEDRCISAREAACLQTFPFNYQFPTDISRSALALMIGNALPPDFSRIQAETIRGHLAAYLEEGKHEPNARLI